MVANLYPRLMTILIACATLLAVAWPGPSHGTLTIRITQGIEGAQPIAVVPFGISQGAPAPPHDIAQIIANDLTRSGRFSPLPVEDLPSRPSDRAAVNFADFRILGTPNLVIGKVKQLDNRGSTFYIARYWAEAMAKHDASFETLAKELMDNEEKIVGELIECQGTPVDLGGYWKPDPAKVEKAMRASPTFNTILDK